jgi:hypothetical protein
LESSQKALSDGSMISRKNVFSLYLKEALSDDFPEKINFSKKTTIGWKCFLIVQ